MGFIDKLYMAKHQQKNLFAIDVSAQNEAPEPDCRHIVRLAFDAGVDGVFDYAVEDDLWPISVGQRVLVSFGRSNKKQIGFCVESAEADFASKKGRKFRLKKVLAIVDKQPLIDEQLMSLAKWISQYYVCPIGQVLSAMVPAAVKKNIGVQKNKFVYLATLNDKSLKLTSKKQIMIAATLSENGADCEKNAMEFRAVTTSVGCTAAPLKTMIKNGYVKVVNKMVFKSLPIVPENMAIDDTDITLNDDQIKTMAHINGSIDKGDFDVTLLHGVTDSGKTEIYIRAIEHVIKKGKTAIIMLPEIAITAQTVQRFSRRFDQIAVMHSSLTAAQRNAQWQKIKSGDADVVIGARSAIFAPLANLGLIVVDEEHESSYKQDTVPRYHGRDVAIKRAHLEKACCILGSATPSVETIVNCRNKKHFTKIDLPKRVNDLPMPEMILIDLANQTDKRSQGLISDELAIALHEAMAKNQQAILLLNRRGYSSVIYCPSCKHTLHCKNCDVTLTFHKAKSPIKAGIKSISGRNLKPGTAQCHYCQAKTLVTDKCPVCSKKMIMIGLGSQKLEEELNRLLPKANIARVDSDSMQKNDYHKLLADFASGKIDILAGTQILAKGLHFPNVTVVGIVSADTCLSIPDFRASERTFQLISQVAGRAGRSNKKGRVFVQTLMADQPAIVQAVANDFEQFMDLEIKLRAECNLPPFCRMAVVILSDENYDRLGAAAERLKNRIYDMIHDYSIDVTLAGPMDAPISRLHRLYRMHIILQSKDTTAIQKLFYHLRNAGCLASSVRTVVDVDPVTIF